MSDQRIRHRLINPAQAAQAWELARQWSKAMLIAGHRLVLDVRKETRSLEQNSRLWAMLTDVSKQVVWYGQTLTPEEWKDVFSAAMHQQKVVPGVESGKFVVLGQRTSQMTRAEMSEMQDLIEAFGAQQGVRFAAPEEQTA